MTTTMKKTLRPLFAYMTCFLMLFLGSSAAAYNISDFEPLTEETTSSWNSSRAMRATGLSTPPNGWRFDSLALISRYGRTYGQDASTRYLLRASNVLGGTARDGRVHLHFSSAHDPIRISYPGGNAYADSFRWELWHIGGSGSQGTACAERIGFTDDMGEGLSATMVASGSSLRNRTYNNITVPVDNYGINGPRTLCFVVYRTSSNAATNLESSLTITADASRFRENPSNTRPSATTPPLRTR